MLRGMCTVTLTADDVPAATRWYADLLGIEPYFVRPEDGPPAYVEFRVGDDEDELGIMDRRYLPETAGSGSVDGTVLYWAVDDIEGAYADLLERGATVHQPVRPLAEPGWAIASVVDPFGNVLGVMSNPHWTERHAVR